MKKLNSIIKVTLLGAALLAQNSFALSKTRVDNKDRVHANHVGINTLSDNESLTIKNGLNAIAKFQDKLDADTWQISKPEMAKLRHISLHVSKLNGSLAEICEKWEHEIAKDENAINNLANIKPEILQDIIADLIMHAAQLSNLIDKSPYTALSQRVARNIQRFAPDSKIKLED